MKIYCATSIGTVLSILLAIKIDMVDIEEYLIKKNWVSFLHNANEIAYLDNEKGLISHNFIKILDVYNSKDIDININFKDLYEISRKAYTLFN